MDKETYKLKEKSIKIIETILAKGDRVELIPLNGYVKIMQVHRNEVSQNNN